MKMACTSRDSWLLRLPDELLVDILARLSDRDILAFGVCNRRCCAVSRTPSLWRTQCEEFFLSKLSTWKCATFFELYTSVVLPHKQYFGLWALDKKPEGGLISIWPCDGVITVKILHPPKHLQVMDPLRAECLFVLETTGNMAGICHRAVPDEEDVCPVKMTYQPKLSSHSQRALGEISTTTKQVEFCGDKTVFEWTKKSRGGFFDHLQRKHRSTMTLCRLTLPHKSLLMPFKTGVYKGAYGAHGVELVCVEVITDKFVRGVKWKGDCNVPCGCVTFCFSLNDKEDIDPGECLRIPAGYIVDGMFSNIEEKPILASYVGQGQIAGDGYMHHSWTPLKVMVFSNASFAVVWLELFCVSSFSYEDKLPTQECTKWCERQR